MFFSEYYDLGRSQEELDFVDIPLERDIAVFLDPFRIKIDNSVLAGKCRSLIIDFFGLLINTIKRGDKIKVLKLLDNCHEANDAHLGYSEGNNSGNPNGAGIGGFQAELLFKKLSSSKATKTGNLKDLEDCALLVEGISDDKISDITINIIREELVSYTISQCKKHKIRELEKARVHGWSSDKQKWVSKIVKLPFYNNKAIILVPKSFVGEGLTINSNAYYTFGFLPYKQQEHLAHPALGLVQIVKGGRKPPTKKDLKKLYPYTKETLNDFTNRNPTELKKFKNYILEKIKNKGIKDIDDTLNKIIENEFKKKRKKRKKK